MSLDLNPTRRDVPLSQWGVAAPCDSDSFKTKPRGDKPLAQSWSHRLSAESASRTGSSLKGAFKYLQRPDMISLGGGLPLSEFFPFDSFTFTVPSIKSCDSPAPRRVDAGEGMRAGKHDILQGHSIYDLSVALNYCQGSGSAQLLRWIVEHTEMIHDPPYADWHCTMTIGSTSALDMTLRMFTKPGEFVLADCYTFSSAVETALPTGVKFFGIPMDNEGLLPQSLNDVLDNWHASEHSDAPKPVILYLIPTGQNPTGATQSVVRRQEIYQVAKRHNLIILEDDPYYLLQMDPYLASSTDCPSSNFIQRPEDLLEALVPSYLNMDTDGRVIRMDSFSKVISPGARLGWITAPKEITERYKTHADVSTQGPSGFSQIALFKLLDEHWGHTAYLEWLVHLRHEYSRRRDCMARACERYLPSDIVSWEPAQAGMYQWLRIDWRKHPEASFKCIDEIEEKIWLAIIERGALVARGSWFKSSKEKKSEDIFYRTTFAAAPMEKVAEAIRRCGEALRQTFQIKN